MTPDELEDAVRAMLAQQAPEDLATVRTKYLDDGIPRIEVERRGGPPSRYVDFHASTALGSGQYSILFGETGGPADTDGRSWGDLAYVLDLIRVWIIELGELSAIPTPRSKI